MKFHPQRFWFLAGALFLACSTVQAQKRVDFSKMRDVSNHDQMSLKLRMAKQSDPITKIGPAIGKVEEDPSKRNAERDLIASSTIICFQDALTLVPKRAVLHLPEMYEDRIGVKAKHKVQTWHEFYARNRGWIRTIEVSREQALGHTPFPEATVEAIKNSDRLVVATYKTGPISVLPLKEPEEVPEPGETKSKIYAQ